MAAVLALVAVSLQLSTPVFGSSASAADSTGSISGFVMGPNGPLGGVLVSADSYYLTYALATTDATGHYTITGLAPGTFHVQFTPPAGSGILNEWYKNKHTSDAAAPVQVVGGLTTPGVNAVLEPAGYIAGTVAGPNGTYPNYVNVCFQPMDQSSLYYYSNNCVQANAAGRYTSPALAAGSYAVSFEPYPNMAPPRLGSQYFDNVSTSSGSFNPTKVPVVYGSTTAGVNAVLRTGTGGNCTVFGPDCTTVRNVSGCIVITQTGPAKAHLQYTCAASSVHWKSNNKPVGHDIVGNPVDMQFSSLDQQWAVSAEATASSTVSTDSAVFKFSTAAPAPPAAPVGVAALVGVEQAPVSWVDVPGATGYLVTASPGGATCAWTSGPRSCTVKYLTPGTPYTFTVTASNAAGPSAPSAPSAPVTPTARRFSDVAIDHPFYADIDWLAGTKITTGYVDGTYKGSLSVQRQAMAAFLYRLAGSPNGPAPTCGVAPFTDVPVGAPFCGEISWLKSTGITTGSGGLFNPTGGVSRGAMAAFLYRFSGSPNGVSPTCASAPFTDVPVGSAFCGEISWLKGTAITTGFPNGTFGPGNLVTREAMAAFLHRLSNLG